MVQPPADQPKKKKMKKGSFLGIENWWEKRWGEREESGTERKAKKPPLTKSIFIDAVSSD